MDFEKSLPNLKRPQWVNYYLDFHRLYEMIPFEFGFDGDRVSDFFLLLESEVDQFCNFYINLETKLVSMKNNLTAKRRGIRHQYLEEAHVYTEELINFSREAMETALFLETNVKATRIILHLYEEQLTRVVPNPREVIVNLVQDISHKTRAILESNILEKVKTDLQEKHLPTTKRLLKQFEEPEEARQLLLESTLASKVELFELTLTDFVDKYRKCKT